MQTNDANIIDLGQLTGGKRSGWEEEEKGEKEKIAGSSAEIIEISVTEPSPRINLSR